MAKKGSKENPITTEDLENLEKPPYLIIEAALKDGFCNYTYEVAKGLGEGDKHAVKGSGLVKDDMNNAFHAFNVHLACIDDVFKHSGIEIENIDDYHTHELAGLYSVTAFSIKGSEESESIILTGTKYLSCGGRIQIPSPKIPLDNLSSYKWYNELKAAADRAREEVALYKEGKYEPVEVEEPVKPTHKQLTIGDAIEDNQNNGGDEGSDDDFENGKL